MVCENIINLNGVWEYWASLLKVLSAINSKLKYAVHEGGADFLIHYMKFIPGG